MVLFQRSDLLEMVQEWPQDHVRRRLNFGCEPAFTLGPAAVLGAYDLPFMSCLIEFLSAILHKIWATEKGPITLMELQNPPPFQSVPKNRWPGFRSRTSSSECPRKVYVKLE